MPPSLAFYVRRVSRALYAVIAIVVFLGDQWTKRLIQESVPRHRVIPVLPGFFNITDSENAGVAFSLFSGSPSPFKTFLLIAASVALLAAVIVIFWRTRDIHWESGVGLSLVLGGALSNLADRLRYGKVVDFLDFYYHHHHWPTFNLADSAIVVGAGFLIIHVLWSD